MVNQQEFFNFVSRYLDDPKITISEYQRRNLNSLIDAMSGGQTDSDSSDSTDSAVGEEELKGADGIEHLPNNGIELIFFFLLQNRCSTKHSS